MTKQHPSPKHVRMAQVDSMRNLSWAHEAILDPFDLGMHITLSALRARPAEVLDELFYGRHYYPDSLQDWQIEDALYAAAEDIRRVIFPRTDLRNMRKSSAYKIGA